MWVSASPWLLPLFVGQLRLTRWLDCGLRCQLPHGVQGAASAHEESGDPAHVERIVDASERGAVRGAEADSEGGECSTPEAWLPPERTQVAECPSLPGSAHRTLLSTSSLLQRCSWSVCIESSPSPRRCGLLRVAGRAAACPIAFCGVEVAISLQAGDTAYVTTDCSAR